MKFCWTTLHVNDLEESLAFYREIVGLELTRRFEGGHAGEIAFLGKGETQLELICNPASPPVDMGRDVSLGFEVASVDEMIAFVQQKGIAVHSGPFQPNPHVKFFYVLDPNGLKIQFVESM